MKGRKETKHFEKELEKVLAKVIPKVIPKVIAKESPKRAPGEPQRRRLQNWLRREAGTIAVTVHLDLGDAPARPEAVA